MHCWPRYLLWGLITVLGVSNMLAACGQKGPLYLPDKRADSQDEQSQSATQKGASTH
ncbi:MAG: lipoprotein [Gammaproteobacteria bacterium]|nr:lipoprotein [Gammaproteobacteria bacterium]